MRTKIFLSGNKSVLSKTSLIQKIFLICIGIFLFLILLEITLRISGFIFTESQEYQNSVTLQKKGTYRIMCIGESTTALGGKDSYPSQLEEILNQAAGGIKFSVINKGICAADTSLLVSQLDYNLDRYNPDIVIAMIGANDGGLHMRYNQNNSSDSRSFFNSLKIYKLAKLILEGIANKIKGMENFPQAEKRLKRFIELYPKNSDAYFKLGRLYMRQGRPLLGEKLLRKAIDLKPDSYTAYLELSQSYYDRAELIEAEKILKRLLELKPNDYRAYLGLARIYRDRGQNSQCEALYKRSIELMPTHDKAYEELGLFYLQNDDYQHAEDNLKKAVALNPGNDNAYEGLFNIYIKTKKYLEAEATLKKALQSNPMYDREYGRLAVFYKKIGDNKNANVYFKQTNELRNRFYNARTINNYIQLRKIVADRNASLMCVQYPLRSSEPLKKIFGSDPGVIIVDNEKNFKHALENADFSEYFLDSFAGDFGHCTRKGNRILAENIANVILKEVFGK